MDDDLPQLRWGEIIEQGWRNKNSRAEEAQNAGAGDFVGRAKLNAAVAGSAQERVEVGGDFDPHGAAGKSPQMHGANDELNGAEEGQSQRDGGNSNAPAEIELERMGRE